jgi:hypothetical protein
VTYRWAADALAIVHLGFVVFVALGSLLALKWPRVAWVHVPAALWGAAIEFGGWICPLTPLENRLRLLGGEAGYEGGFVENYLLALLYPEELTRRMQVALGAIVLMVNLAAYAWLARRRTRRQS